MSFWKLGVSFYFGYKFWVLFYTWTGYKIIYTFYTLIAIYTHNIYTFNQKKE